MWRWIVPRASLQLLLNPHLRKSVGAEILQDAPDRTHKGRQSDWCKDNTTQDILRFAILVMEYYQQDAKTLEN